MTLADLLFSLRSPSFGTCMSVLEMTTVILGIGAHKYSEQSVEVKKNKAQAARKSFGCSIGLMFFIMYVLLK